jgi:UPF0755 protein
MRTRPRGCAATGGGDRSGAARLGVLHLLVAAALVALGMAAWSLLTPTAALREGPRIVDIPAQLGLGAVARQLQEEGVVRTRVGFTLLALATGNARTLKAGEYQVPGGADAVQVLRLLASGRVLQRQVVFPEGHTVAELARLLESERLANADALLRVARDSQFLVDLGIEAESLEGYLFPDTYHFVRGMPPEDILGRMVARLRKQLSPDILEQIRARDLSLHEALTMASIIEREAVDPAEMPLISAVFWNRLRQDMPLQADPTVQYAVGRERQRLTRDDLQNSSPFNTYRRLGLPPGPIASPGLAAIRAALNPAPVNYLYFVALDERRHHFSATLEDHNAAVARYRLSRPR